jgi:hypothetical protein
MQAAQPRPQTRNPGATLVVSSPMIPPMPLSYDLVKNAKYSPLLLFSAMFLKHQNETAPQRHDNICFSRERLGKWSQFSNSESTQTTRRSLL